MPSMPQHPRRTHQAEPTAADLAAIEAEWPAIVADLDVLDAEISILSTKRPSDLDWRRLRRAQARMIRTLLDAQTRTQQTPSAGGVAA